jgi:hypothetical protein
MPATPLSNIAFAGGLTPVAFDVDGSTLVQAGPAEGAFVATFDLERHRWRSAERPNIWRTTDNAFCIASSTPRCVRV